MDRCLKDVLFSFQILASKKNYCPVGAIVCPTHGPIQDLFLGGDNFKRFSIKYSRNNQEFRETQITRNSGESFRFTALRRPKITGLTLHEIKIETAMF